MSLLDALEWEYSMFWRNVEVGQDPLTEFVKQRLPNSSTTDRIMLRTLCSLRDRADVFDKLTERHTT